jgi:MFS family permease
MTQGLRTFSIIWFGQLISTLGSGLSGFALGVWLYQDTGSATLFAIANFIWFLPSVLVSPVAGVLSDRWDRRWVMILADVMAGLATLFIGLMVFTDNLQVWQIYLTSFLLSTANTFQWPAYSAATTLMVPKKHLGRASGMTQLGDAISSLVTPALAGAMYVTVGLKLILMIDIATFLVALGTLVVVRFPQPVQTEAGRAAKGSFWQEALYGWHYIRQRAGLIRFQIVLAGMNFASSVMAPLFIPLILEMTTADILGYVTSITSIGVLVGSLVMSAWGGFQRRIYGSYLGQTAYGITSILIGLSTSIPFITVARFLGMLFSPLSSGSIQAIWQSKVDQDVQGRVMAVRRMISFSTIPLAYLVSGPLAEKVFNPLLVEGGSLADGLLGEVFGVGQGRGIGLMFAIFGAIYLLLAQFVYFDKNIWWVELDLPDAVPSDEQDKTGPKIDGEEAP